MRSVSSAQILSAALSQTEAGVKIHYRTDGDFFNLLRLKSYTKVTRAIVRDFLFADDCALAAHSEVDLQELADCFATAAKSFGLTVSIKKTEVLRHLAPNTARPPRNITMDGNALKNVDTFKYLGSCKNSAANLDDEVLCRISRASQAFGHLHTRVLHERGISIKTKLSVYRAVVLPSLLYGCETWTCYRRHTKKLDWFHLRCLRKVLHVSWKDHVKNHEILRRAEFTGIEAMLNQAQLRWSGHVTRMDDSRLPKQLFHAELSTGKRHKGGQRKRYCCGCFNKAAFLMYAVYLQVHPTTYNKELSLLTVHKRTNMAQSLAYNHPITHNHQHTIIQSHSLAQSLAYNHSTTHNH